MSQASATFPRVRIEHGKPATTYAPPGIDTGEAREWLAVERDALRGVLAEHGALLIRGLPMRSTQDFGLLRDQLVGRRADYREKATPRSHFGDDVHSSTDLPPSQRINLHNENSYTLTFPGILLFGCLVAPETGGATPVADVRTVLRLLPGELVGRFRELGWCLSRSFGEHFSLDWRTSFNAADRAAVERYCADNAIGYRWGDGETLHTTQVRPAVVRHPGTGEEVWFNHAAFWSEWSLDPDIRQVLVDELGPNGLPFNTGFGDGTPLSSAEVAAINAAYDVATVRERWEVGDLLVVDNLLAAHGRDPFRGDRRIVVAMGDPVRLADCSPGHVRAEPEPSGTGSRR